MAELHAFDLETHLIQPGLRWPPIVCGSAAEEAPGSERILSPEDAHDEFERYLTEQIGGQNLVYDLGCMCARWPEFVEPVFRMLAEGRAISADILEALHDNAAGTLGVDPRTGQPVGYSMETLAARHLGEDLSEEKKNPHSWRFRYAELAGVPLEDWPEEARAYPMRDARHTFDILQQQLDPERENLSCYDSEMRAAWFLALACAWGMRTDPQLTPHVVAEITRKHEESRRKFIDAGIVRIRKCTKKKDKETGISALEEADEITAEEVGDAINRLEDVRGEWVRGRIAELRKALEQIRGGAPVRFAVDKGRLQELVSAAYLGDPPLTDGGKSQNPQTKTDRDTLLESGDPLLEEYGEAGGNEKLYSTYVDVLNQGIRVPINPEANVMVATDRTSYRRPNLQQLPRKGMVRECFVPRGYRYEAVDAHPAAVERDAQRMADRLVAAGEAVKREQISDSEGSNAS